MSAVILAVIVVMWAVVLVPMWLRRHDAATESRSADRFSAAMRVLSRRQPADRRYVLMPKRPASSVEVHVSGASARPARPARPSAPVRPMTPAKPARRTTSTAVSSARPGAASLAARRRRALLGLAAIAFLTFVLAVAGVMGWVLQLVIDLVLVAFVVHLRTQAKRMAALARQRNRVPAEGIAPAASRPAARLAASLPAARPAARVSEPVLPAVEPEPMAAPVEARPLVHEPAVEAIVAAAEADAEIVATGTDDAGASAWEPIPVPRPTYTMKPPAPPRRYAPIYADSDPSAETSPSLAIPAEAVAAAAGAAEPVVEDDGTLDEILTHRWAVND